MMIMRMRSLIIYELYVMIMGNGMLNNGINIESNIYEIILVWF